LGAAFLCAEVSEKTGIFLSMKKPTTTAELIRQRIENMPLGELFTGDEFLDLGTRARVLRVLGQLAKTDLIKRVSRGIYCRPKISELLGPIGPSTAKLVNYVMRGQVYQVHGAEAARRMELSTQVPMSHVFVTTGRARTISRGKMVIEFRHISARKVLLAGRPAGFALTALWYLGKNEVTPRIVGKIRRVLGEEEFEALKSVVGSMPEWMRAAMMETANG
jgi:hypothetical protein